MYVNGMTVREVVQMLDRDYGMTFAYISIRLANQYQIAKGPVEEILEEYGDEPAVYARFLRDRGLHISF